MSAPMVRVFCALTGFGLGFLPSVALADRAAAHYHQAMALKRAGRVDGAIKELIAALEERDSYAAAHYSIGILYRKKGDYPQAIHHLERGIALEPKNGKMYYSLGLSYFSNGQKDKALETLRRAADLLPNDTQVLGQVGVLLIRKDPEKAIAVLSKVVRKERDPEQIHQLGLAYRKATSKLTGPTNDAKRKAYLKKAEKYLLWALSLKASPPLHFDLGVLYRRMDDPRKAIRHYESAVRSDPKLAAAWWDLGHMYNRESRSDEAIDAYEQYLKLRGTSGDAKIARQRIRELRGKKK